MYLALVGSVIYRESFGTTEEVTTFVDHVKEHGGSSSLKVSTDFLGKRTHSAIGICLKYFEQVLQKRMINTVRLLFYFEYVSLKSVWGGAITFINSLYPAPTTMSSCTAA